VTGAGEKPDPLGIECGAVAVIQHPMWWDHEPQPGEPPTEEGYLIQRVYCSRTIRHEGMHRNGGYEWEDQT
jgi:hypothetical protein